MRFIEDFNQLPEAELRERLFAAIDTSNEMTAAGVR